MLLDTVGYIMLLETVGRGARWPGLSWCCNPTGAPSAVPVSTLDRGPDTHGAVLCRAGTPDICGRHSHLLLNGVPVFWYSWFCDVACNGADAGYWITPPAHRSLTMGTVLCVDLLQAEHMHSDTVSGLEHLGHWSILHYSFSAFAFH